MAVERRNGLESYEELDEFELEAKIKAYFNTSFDFYMHLWDQRGTLHFGIFDEFGIELPSALKKATFSLVEKIELKEGARILDLGCGTGTALMDIAELVGGNKLEMYGLDICNRAIDEATRVYLQKKEENKLGVQIKFLEGTGSRLWDYFGEEYVGRFTHIISQDAIFLMPNKAKIFKDIKKLLQDGGYFGFMDFTMPIERSKVSPETKKHVIDRVMWKTGFSLNEYIQMLNDIGFKILYAQDFAKDVRTTYERVGMMAGGYAKADSIPPEIVEYLSNRQQVSDQQPLTWVTLKEKYAAFAESCGYIVAAVDKGEFSGCIIVAKKCNGEGKKNSGGEMLLK